MASKTDNVVMSDEQIRLLEYITNHNPRTGLLYSAEMGLVESMKYFSTKASDDDHNDALVISAKHDNAEGVALCLSKGATKRVEDALKAAARYAAMEAFKGGFNDDYRPQLNYAFDLLYDYVLKNPGNFPLSEYELQLVESHEIEGLMDPGIHQMSLMININHPNRGFLSSAELGLINSMKYFKSLADEESIKLDYNEALKRSVQCGNTEGVQLCIDNGANEFLACSLDTAVLNGYEDIFTLLVKHYPPNDINSALIDAVHRIDIRMVRICLRYATYNRDELLHQIRMAMPAMDKNDRYKTRIIRSLVDCSRYLA